MAWLRWLAMVPLAVVLTAIVQIGATAVFEFVLAGALGYALWTTWLARAIAAGLMGVTFVQSFWILAPHSKRFVAALALATVGLWGIRMALASLVGEDSLWVAATGLAGITGAFAAFLLSSHILGNRRL